MPPVDHPSVRARWKHPLLAALACAAALAVGEALVFRYLFAYGVSNVWNGDGLAQHFPALYYFRDTVGAFLADPSKGIASWSWRLGMGADTFTTLSYYLADPFSAISLLFPLRWAEYVYEGLYFLRITLAGLAAFAYLRSLKARDWTAVLGSLVYAIASFALVAGLKHPLFVNAMIWFPLVLLGIEQVLNGRRWYVLVVAVALSALSNFYFFYQISLIAVPYAALRYIELTPRGERWRRLWRAGGTTALLYALGALVASAVLVPVVSAVLASSRTEQSQVIGLLANPGFYRSYLIALLTPRPGPNSMYGGFCVLAVAIWPVLFMRKRNLTVKAMLVLFPVMLTFPFFGKLFNGMSYVGYRFLFMWGLFIAAGLALVLSDDRRLDRRELLVMAGGIAAGSLALGWAAHVTRLTLAATAGPVALGIAAWTIFALDTWFASRRGARPGAPPVRPEGPARDAATDVPPAEPPGRPAGFSVAAKVALVLLVFTNIAGLGLGTYSKRYASLLAGYVPLGQVLAKFTQNPGMTAGSLPGGPLARIDKQVSTRGTDFATSQSNDALVQGYAGISFYYSLLDDGLVRYIAGLQDRSVRMSFDFGGFDDRAALDTLAAVRYYVADPSGVTYVPYGFVRDGSIGGAELYRNRYALPVGFVYHAAVDSARYEALSALEKQQALLQGVVVDASVAPGVPRVSPMTGVVDVPYTVETTGSVRFDAAKNTLATTDKDTGVTLRFPAQPGAELYVQMEGASFRLNHSSYESELGPDLASIVGEFTDDPGGPGGSPNSPLHVDVSAGGPRKVQRLQAPLGAYYWGQTAVLANMGYSASGETSATFRLTEPASVTFSSLKVLALPMGDYAARVTKLARDGMSDVVVGNDTLSGTVAADGAGVLYLSIPYSTGWTATVDGVPAPIVRANVGFSGVAITGGTHQVVLRYRTPGLTAGLLLGGFGLVLFAAVVVLTERRIRGLEAPARKDG
jgi:uncharacterized membrane protein YfhO